MSSKNRDVTLRAFEISTEDTNISHEVNIFEDFKRKLNASKTSGDRCMMLNGSDPNEEKDLISDYQETETPKSIFCTMLRIIPGEDAQHIPEELLEQKTFSMEEVEELQETHNLPNLCKESFYFATCGKYLVTNLRGNKTIKDLQTYISWLLGNDLLVITPIVNIPDDIPLKDIKNITFSDSYVADSFRKREASSHGQETSFFNIKQLGKSFIKNILSETQGLDEIDFESIIEANLVVKWSKPKEMSREEYQKVMGALIKPISDLEGMVVYPKKGRSISGQEIPRSKLVSIANISSGKISEIALKQEMSKFLNELKNE